MFWRASPHRLAMSWPLETPGFIARDSCGVENDNCIVVLKDTFEVLADEGGPLPLRPVTGMPAQIRVGRPAAHRSSGVILTLLNDRHYDGRSRSFPNIRDRTGAQRATIRLIG